MLLYLSSRNAELEIKSSRNPSITTTLLARFPIDVDLRDSQLSPIVFQIPDRSCLNNFVKPDSEYVVDIMSIFENATGKSFQRD